MKQVKDAEEAVGNRLKLIHCQVLEDARQKEQQLVHWKRVAKSLNDDNEHHVNEVIASHLKKMEVVRERDELKLELSLANARNHDETTCLREQMAEMEREKTEMQAQMDGMREYIEQLQLGTLEMQTPHVSSVKELWSWEERGLADSDLSDGACDSDSKTSKGKASTNRRFRLPRNNNRSDTAPWTKRKSVRVSIGSKATTNQNECPSNASSTSEEEFN